MSTYWVRDRRGDRLQLPSVIKMLRHDTAQAVGLHDRGLLRPGSKADVNVLDFDNRRTARTPSARPTIAWLNQCEWIDCRVTVANMG